MQSIMVSIIIPVYKVEQYIDRCIQSVLNQTYTNFEVILIDDGSPDRCGEICDIYAQKDMRIHVIHQKNAGLSAARNSGLVRARGKYIAFIDSDDFVSVDFLEKTLNAIETEQSDVLIFNAEYYGKKQKELVGWNITQNSNQTEKIKTKLLIGDDCYVWRKIYRREMWQSIRFPEGLNYEDIYVNMDVISYAKRMTAISDVLYFYEVGKHGSIMQTKSVSNKYSVLTHHIRNFQKVSEIKDYFFLQKLYYYTALAAWDDWAFLSKKTENFSFSKAQELRNKITNNEFYRVNMDSLQIQLEFYSSKAFMEYEKIQILEKECLDAKKNKKELIRYIVYVVCLARSINQEDKDDKTMLSVLLDMGRHIEQYGSIRQKLLLLANRYELTPILKMEGSHLIRKGI